MHERQHLFLYKLTKIHLPFDRIHAKEYNDLNQLLRKGDFIVNVFAMAMMMEMRMCPMCMFGHA